MDKDFSARTAKKFVKGLTPDAKWNLKQALASDNDAHYYGDGGTIHATSHLDVGVSDDGLVEAVWFRCLMLPFNQYPSSDLSVGKGNPLSRINGIEIIN